MSAKSALGSRVLQPRSSAKQREGAQHMAASLAAVGAADDVPRSCCCVLLAWVLRRQRLENLRVSRCVGAARL